jgi:hypothetical protein
MAKIGEVVRTIYPQFRLYRADMIFGGVVYQLSAAPTDAQ